MISNQKAMIKLFIRDQKINNHSKQHQCTKFVVAFKENDSLHPSHLHLTH